MLVTGASGFIGKNLVKELSKKHEITCLVRDIKKSSALKDYGATLIKGCLEDKKSLRKALKNSEIVYHLASVANPNLIKDENLCKISIEEGTKNLVEVCDQKGIEKFIFFSSIGAIGARNVKAPVDENVDCRPTSFYGIYKRRAELFLLKKFSDSGFPAIIIRPPVVYGPGDPYNFLALAKSIKIKAKNKKPFYFISHGNNLISLCFIRNLVSGTLLIGKRGKIGEIYHIADARPYTVKEEIETIANQLDVKIRYVSIPKPIAFSASVFLELLIFIGLEPPLNIKKYRDLTANFWLDIEKLKKLGYSPKDDFVKFTKETIESFDM